MDRHPYENGGWRMNEQGENRPKYGFDKDRDLSEWITKYQEEKLLTPEELSAQKTRACRLILQIFDEWTQDRKIIGAPKLTPKDFIKVNYYSYATLEDMNGNVCRVLVPVDIETCKMPMKIVHKSKYRKSPERNFDCKVGINFDVKLRNDQQGPHGPHVGFNFIVTKGIDGVEKLTGHILLNSRGNEDMPHRSKRSIKNCDDDSIPRIDVQKLFSDSQGSV